VFDKLIEYLVSWIDLFKPLRVVQAWEKAVLLRRGLYVRTLDPGWHWVIPLAIDEVIRESVVTDTTRTSAQSLTTSDGVNVAVSVVVTWRVQNVRKVLLEVQGKEQAMLDAATGVIARHVTSARWADLTSDEFMRTVQTEITARAKRWGLKVEDVSWHDLAQCTSLRLLGLPSSPAA
jgi:regulator of protease activity HflC (stomatin/prohibitin superfamily)